MSARTCGECGGTGQVLSRRGLTPRPVRCDACDGTGESVPTPEPGECVECFHHGAAGVPAVADGLCADCLDAGATVKDGRVVYARVAS